MHKRLIATFALTILLVGCRAEQPVDSVVAAAPVADTSPDGLGLEPLGARAWDPAWTRIVVQAIGVHSPELLTPAAGPLTEIEEFCPQFQKASGLDKARFIALFLASVSRFESGFDPKSTFQEPWTDAETGKAEQSQGLLQLSYSDQSRHPDCRLDRAAGNIFEPAVNLACGVAILRKQLAHKGTFFPGPRPYYWAVLTSADVKPKLVGFLRDHARRLPFCSAPLANR